MEKLLVSNKFKLWNKTTLSFQNIIDVQEHGTDDFLNDSRNAKDKTI